MVQNLIMNLAGTALFFLWSLSVAAQGLAPNTTYDPAIPTLEAVAGHRPGEAITTPEEVGRYLEALAKAAPRSPPRTRRWRRRITSSPRAAARMPTSHCAKRS
jgi:hypothetical protein